MIDVQRTDFVAVPTRDRERAAAFYGETLGLTKNPSSTDTWIEFETGNLTLQILEPEAFGMEFRPSPNPLALHVEDVPAARKELEDRGITFLADTMDSGVCHMAPFADPDGNVLMLHHRYAPPEARPPGVEG